MHDDLGRCTEDSYSTFTFVHLDPIDRHSGTSSPSSCSAHPRAPTLRSSSPGRFPSHTSAKCTPTSLASLLYYSFMVLYLRAKRLHASPTLQTCFA